MIANLSIAKGMGYLDYNKIDHLITKLTELKPSLTNDRQVMKKDLMIY